MDDIVQCGHPPKFLNLLPFPRVGIYRQLTAKDLHDQTLPSNHTEQSHGQGGLGKRRKKREPPSPPGGMTCTPLTGPYGTIPLLEQPP